MHVNELVLEMVEDISFISKKGQPMIQVVLQDNQLKKFMNYAMKTCNSFSLVFEKNNDKTRYVCNSIYKKLEASLIEKRNVVIHPDTGSCFENSDIIYFDCNRKSSNIFILSDDIWNRSDGSIVTELCFYRRGGVWFKYIEHAKLSFVMDVTYDDIEFFEKNNIEYWYED